MIFTSVPKKASAVHFHVRPLLGLCEQNRTFFFSRLVGKLTCGSYAAPFVRQTAHIASGFAKQRRHEELPQPLLFDVYRQAKYCFMALEKGL